MLLEKKKQDHEIFFFFALTEAKCVAGEFKHIFLAKVQNAAIKIQSCQDNVAGVQLPKFEHFTQGEKKNGLTGLAREGQQFGLHKYCTREKECVSEPSQNIFSI